MSLARLSNVFPRKLVVRVAYTALRFEAIWWQTSSQIPSLSRLLVRNDRMEACSVAEGVDFAHSRHSLNVGPLHA